MRTDRCDSPRPGPSACPAFGRLAKTAAALCVVCAFGLAFSWPGVGLAQIFPVTNTNAAGAGSLDQAVTDLNASGAAGTVRFDAGSAGVVNLAAGLVPTQQASFLNQSGGGVTASLQGGAYVTCLTASSLGDVGGTAALIFRAIADTEGAYTIFSTDAIAIGSFSANAAAIATAGTDFAEALRSETGTVTIAGALAGDLTATATGGSFAVDLEASTGVTIGSVADTAGLTATSAVDHAYGILNYNGQVAVTGEMAGDIQATATAGAYAYGINSGGTIAIGSIADTGSVTATAGGAGEAAGMYADGGITVTGELAGTVAASAPNGANANGLHSGGAISIGSVGATGRVTATADAGPAVGVNGANVAIVGAMNGIIQATVTTGTYAYGLFSENAITLGSMGATGAISATSAADNAFGFHAATGITVTGALAGDVIARVTGGPFAYGLHSDASIAIGSIASTGSVTADATSEAVGLSAGGGITITGELAGTVTATARTGEIARGIHAGESIVIGSITGTAAQNGGVWAVAATDQAAGILAGNTVTVGSIGQYGEIFVQGGQNANGIYAANDDVEITGVLAGTVQAVAENGQFAYGLQAGDAIRIGSVAETGGVSALAQAGLAYGLFAGTSVTIAGELAGGISANSPLGDEAYGIGTWGGIAIGSIAETGGVSALALNQARGLSATTGLTITGGMDGVIQALATVGSEAYGILVTNGSVRIGSMAATADVAAIAGANSAYGIFAGQDLVIAGGMAGNITAMADGHTAVGMQSLGEMNGGDAATPLAISGTVAAEANGLAVAVASVGSMNLYVTGTLSGIDTSGGGDGYAIRAGWPDGAGGWNPSNPDNRVVLGTGATLVGRVDLGNGDNTVGFLGTGSTANMLLGATHLVAGDGLLATFWNLNPTAADAYTVFDATVNAGATLSLNENVTILTDVANTGTLQFDLGANRTYGGIISGTGGVTKTGDANLILSGANTYTGTTLAAEGRLRVVQDLHSRSVGVLAGATLELDQNYAAQGTAVVDGSLIVPQLTVAAGATLSGSGTVFGNVVSGGLISPGASPGTLSIQGNLFLGAGSTLFMEITPTGSDLLLVSGTTTIDGGALHVDIARGYYQTGQSITLLRSTGGITGDYATITVDNHSQFLVFSIENTDTETVGTFGAEATVTRLPYTIAGTSGNSMAAAAGLTGATFLATPSMQAVLATIDFTSLGEVARGLRQMSPEPYSAMNETAFSAMRLFSDTIRDRTYAKRLGGETLLTAVTPGNIGRLTQLASAGGLSDAGSGLDVKGVGTGMALFVKPVGQYQSFENGHNRTGFTSWQYGVMAGGDAQITDNFLAGFQVGYLHSNLRFKDDATSTGYADAFLGGLYASATAGGFYADGLVQAGASVNHLDRRIEFGGISREPTGKYTSFLFGASFSTGYEWTFGNFQAGPVGTLDYGYVSNPGFAESDPDLGLTVSGFSGNSLKTGLGAKISGTFTAGETTTISPDLALRWGHEFLDSGRNISARYNGSPTSGFTSRTGDPARDSLLVDAGVSLGVSESTKLYVRYSGEFLGQGTQTQAGAVGVRYEF
ncbi:autotransporter outer membrane beta-barrel domain-containing protein [Desulfolutivibrio sulfoxidireducens]|uniref:autotransporter outer membrane beta-barrel domain-containing protein n=1 Tax=Desulfolutivibrio sulfoxidireducens TaxID=2773299 RepID=UPI00159D959B|nr:autotransporter outer membrane beta-barrel domain-containing protein [Desulfolutivibrio sulfoxidireducens]QLA15562.1 autotransporter domain-containing protein [Desulfolutivibrio sulfoxidireducens]